MENTSWTNQESNTKEQWRDGHHVKRQSSKLETGNVFPPGK